MRLVTPDATYETTAGRARPGRRRRRHRRARCSTPAGASRCSARSRWLTLVRLAPRVEPVLIVDAESTPTHAVIALEGEARVGADRADLALGDDGTRGRSSPGVPGSGIDAGRRSPAAPARPPPLDGRRPDRASSTSSPSRSRRRSPTRPCRRSSTRPTPSPTAPLAVTVEGETVGGRARGRALLAAARAGDRRRPADAAPSTRRPPSPASRELFPDVGEPPVDASFDVVDGTPVDHPERGRHRLLRRRDGRSALLDALRGRRRAAVELALGPTPRRGHHRAELEGLRRSRSRSAAPGRGRRAAADEVGARVHHLPRRRRGPGHQHPPHRRPRPRRGDPAGRHVLGERPRRAAHHGERLRRRPAPSATASTSSEVGGGVSQFATTLFNAAYFAGLDIASTRPTPSTSPATRGAGRRRWASPPPTS